MVLNFSFISMKSFKRIIAIVSFVFVGIFSEINAQDIIYTKANQRLIAKVITVSETDVQYSASKIYQS